MLAPLLAGCEDPKPGLVDEKREEKVVDCKAVIGHFAPTERKKEQLCECTTARLAAQRLTLADLSGPKQDRAMEQLRWCGEQVGVFGKGGKPKSLAKPAAEDTALSEPDDDTTQAPAADTGKAPAAGMGEGRE